MYLPSAQHTSSCFIMPSTRIPTGLKMTCARNCLGAHAKQIDDNCHPNANTSWLIPQMPRCGWLDFISGGPIVSEMVSRMSHQGNHDLPGDKTSRSQDRLAPHLGPCQVRTTVEAAKDLCFESCSFHTPQPL
ncbi:uncharacterized protein CC84DRAFT_476201 [Paraphaeosphaeria sporulosa]|uniref:Uncharacterized protein n=1 Tax=Paraphaeosphaeria sporulosa TaxID=1460663 RepID=A0A177CRX0_9PLEO|nr:uncharacterized protein CC84DRAFT_476201 [Paraphaeosphaeria sporulosa]OAG10273.1 hypothetical protein CC84DRAFT_476201 [Paraphaeosphaeria sporulosa]